MVTPHRMENELGPDWEKKMVDQGGCDKEEREMTKRMRELKKAFDEHKTRECFCCGLLSLPEEISKNFMCKTCEGMTVGDPYVTRAKRHLVQEIIRKMRDHYDQEVGPLVGHIGGIIGLFRADKPDDPLVEAFDRAAKAITPTQPPIP